VQSVLLKTCWEMLPVNLVPIMRTPAHTANRQLNVCVILVSVGRTAASAPSVLQASTSLWLPMATVLLVQQEHIRQSGVSRRKTGASLVPSNLTRLREIDCQMCAPGTYSNHSGAHSVDTCIVCAAGKYSNISGADSVDSCLACGVDTYSSALGVNTCLLCPSLSNSPSGSMSSAVCLCSPGSTGDTSENCQVCQIGSYKEQAGSALCSLCAEGISSLPGSILVVDCICSAGFRRHDGVCRACAAGKWKPENGSAPCLECPQGSSSLPGSYALTGCTCNRGSSGSNGGPCLQCESGKYKEYPGEVA